MKPITIISLSLTLTVSVSICLAAEPIVRDDEALTGFTDPEGRAVTVETGNFGQLTDGINAAGLRTTINRDANGSPLVQSLPSGAVIEKSFDQKGNELTRTNQTLGGTVAFEYDEIFDQIVKMTDATGNVTNNSYDTAGNFIQTISPLGQTTNMTYQTQGLLTGVTLASGETIRFNYNSSLNQSENAHGIGIDTRESQLTYTTTGYLDLSTDPLGRVTDIDYDVMGRVTAINLPNNRTLSYQYDSGGLLTQIDATGRASYTYSYDSVGQLTAEHYPAVVNGGSLQTSYSYNLARQPKTITRADGIEISFGYDSSGRITRITEPRGVTRYQYNATTGLIDSMVSPDGITQTHNYKNELLTEVSWSGPVAGSVGYDYSTRGNVTTLTIAGDDIIYAYSADNELIQAGEQTLNYDPVNGYLTSTSLQNITQNYQYNQFSEMTRHTATFKNTELYDVEYSRDKLGRITTLVETIEGVTRTVNYTYDLSGRIETVREDNILIDTFTYDNNNNRTNNNAAYDAQDRLLSQTGITYSYNPHGELIQKTEGSNVSQYQYNVEGNLIGSTLSNGDQIRYLLDGQGRRLVRQFNGIASDKWLYADQLNPVAQLDSNNAVTQRYIYSHQNSPAYLKTGGNNYTMISNHLDSIRLIINTTTGGVTQRIDYDSWGRVTADTNPNFQPFAFAGGLYEQEAGLTHFGYREYDAAAGSWTSKDPTGFDGSPINLYSYVEGDPVNVVDLTGLEGNSESTKPGRFLGYEYRGPTLKSYAVVHAFRGSPGGLRVKRGGRVFQLAPGSPLFVRDIIYASDDTTAIIDIGKPGSGRTVIKPGKTKRLKGWDDFYLRPTVPLPDGLNLDHCTAIRIR